MEIKKILEQLKYLKLLITPFIISMIGSLIWFKIKNAISFEKEDENVLELLLGIISIAHGMIASFQIEKVANQQDAIYQALKTQNKELFLATECLKINPVIKFLLFIFSIIFFLIFLFYPFKSIYDGMIVVFLTIFILYLLWEVAVELDDPYHGIWKINKEEIMKIFNEDLSKGKAL